MMQISPKNISAFLKKFDFVLKSKTADGHSFENRKITAGLTTV